MSKSPQGCLVLICALVAATALGVLVPGNVITNPDQSGGPGNDAWKTPIPINGPCNFKYLGGFTNPPDTSRCWESIVNDPLSNASTLVNTGTYIVPVVNEGKAVPIQYAFYAANANGSMGTDIITMNWTIPKVRLNKGPSGAVNPSSTPAADITLYSNERLFDGSEGTPNPTSARPYKWYFETAPGSGNYQLDPNCKTTKWCDHSFPSYGSYKYWLTVPYGAGYISEDCPQGGTNCARYRGAIQVAQLPPTATPTPIPTPPPTVYGVINVYYQNGTIVNCDAFWNGCPSTGDRLYAVATRDWQGTPINLPITWNFGNGSVPSTGTGATSPVFYYTSTGGKTISFTTSDPYTRASYDMAQIVTPVGPTPTPTRTPTPGPTATPTPTPTPTPGANTPPVITLFNVSDTNPTVNVPVTFNCVSTGNPLPLNTISFGDGTPDTTGVSAVHTYTRTGVFSARCIADNGILPNGLDAQRTIGITVKNPDTSSVWILPSSANAPGANGAYYTTALSIGNRDVKSAAVQLKFLGHDSDGTGGPVVNQNIPSKGSFDVLNILDYAFSLTNAYGAIKIVADTAMLNVTSQTSTPLSTGGTVGQSVPGVPATDFISYGSSKSLISLQENAAFRTNLIIANASATSIVVKGDLYDSTGLLRTTNYWTVPALTMTQLGRVINTMFGSMTNATLILTTTTPGGSFATYASVIDNVTNDPRTVLPK